ncbi:MAG: hypothetical protein U9P79_07665, partial [Candidatus Cloacimonadota bacterium]|nr:hypothetical protein [Candidatus Cloacimonadota bacterium]
MKQKKLFYILTILLFTSLSLHSTTFESKSNGLNVNSIRNKDPFGLIRNKKNVDSKQKQKSFESKSNETDVGSKQKSNRETIIVDIDGGGNYLSIQDGINAASDGDTILVHPGTYYENINFNGKDLTLISLEMITGDESYIDSTIINGQQEASCICLENHETALIQGFSITNGCGDYSIYVDDYIGGGIKIYSTNSANPLNVYIKNCKIFNNNASVGGGIEIHKSNVYLSGLEIINNYANAAGGIGISYTGYTNPCNVEFDEDNRCNIYNNYAGTGSDIAAYAAGEIYVNVDTFTVADPLGYFVFTNGHGNSQSNLYFDIEHTWLEQVNHDLYVSTSGDDNNSGFSPQEPLQTISWAMHKIVSDTIDPKTVYVEDGIYSHADNNQIFPISLKSHVPLIGESRENTILENDFMEKSSTMMIASKQQEIRFENFTMHNISESPRGFLINEGINVIIKNIMVENMTNPIEMSIANMIMNPADNFYLSDVIIRNNTFGAIAGIWCQSWQYGELKNCIFDNNHSTGGNDEGWVVVDYITEENGLWENCVISNCSNQDYFPYTVQIGSGSDSLWFDMFNCLFVNNVAEACTVAIGIPGGGKKNIVNCTFANNYAWPAATLMTGDTINLVNTVM